MTANGKSFRSHKEQFPEMHAAAEAALLAATDAEINAPHKPPCFWPSRGCSCRFPLDNFIVPDGKPADPRDALIAELAAALEIGVPLMQRWADEGYYGDVPNSRAWLTNAKAVLARAALARVKEEAV